MVKKKSVKRKRITSAIGVPKGSVFLNNGRLERSVSETRIEFTGQPMLFRKNSETGLYEQQGRTWRIVK